MASSSSAAPPRRLAVMTSGGDSAGMNAAVRAVVKMAIFRGCEAFVIREGWEGLVRGNHSPDGTPITTPALSRNNSGFFDSLDPRGRVDQQFGGAAQHGEAVAATAAAAAASTTVEGQFVPTYGEGEALREGVGEAQELGLRGRYIIRVGWDDVRGWMDQGGTLIGTARCKEFRTVEGREKAAYNLIVNGIDALAVCGGDGSLTGADRLRAEWPDLVASLLQKGRITDEQATRYAHLNIVGLVGSIDNDMATTDITIGASTALQRICESIDSISSTAASHSRAFVVEVMGRHCGWLAVMAGIATGADYIFIPEQPPQRGDHWSSEMCDVLRRHRELGKRKSIVIIAEGAHDRDLNEIKPEMVKDVLTHELGLDTRVTTLGHTQRGGKPDANDRILATLQGVEAVNAVLEATPETPSYVIGMTENKVTRIPLMHAVEQTQRVAAEIEAKNFDAALALRDPEFEEGLRAFKIISQITEANRLPADQRLRIGIIHIGAPAGGMNAATRTMVRYCLDRGHEPVVIYNGFNGLLEDNVSVLSWLRVDNWATRGGSELGVNRNLPDIDLGAVAAKFQQHRIEALLMIGGFEAFMSVKILDDNRERYPAFRMPIVALPATISNNVPMNEFSLGSDTSLNALVDACDAVKQSASASRNRVFVVETQGGRCGYIAVAGALAAGAVLVYTPEQGIGLQQLGKDVEFLKKRFALDVKGKSEGRLVIRNEKSSEVFTTEVITKILKEEGASLFDSRSASLGHTLQGGTPSPLDRIRATRLALKCCQFLEAKALESRRRTRRQQPGGSKADADGAAAYSDDTAVMITIQGAKICFATVKEMAKHADMKNRRAKKAWWHDLKALVELMGGRTGLGNL
ncbi:uncharacterized protein PFL1_05832 [Pseudozyma flocculosa PF-1]|uniref:ATP-dependent 6-phosphofructokinase n=2 Tax=Pseudozyma flocculosa TaxID=84751 RepID=A0A5C3F5H8_9BASI|nr:uncharacterized protein PFL1_05832 [Pseudozyma flocculosa PF-1]EPQ26510.1 hypothetical protein PFL1_05832 [Pseudozyma flocculosa PF-1]SPO38501.1 probable 6-phosphofructokinase [Pseudozyma flocculosa]